MSVKGRIHSMESFGTVDGPGIRFVVFLQGCPLHCLYCHNPDALSCTDGEEKTSAEVFEYVMRFRSFIRSGGVTLSGGEPLRQPEFCLDLLQRFRGAGVHTAVDTSGIMPLDTVKACVDKANLILLDIKAIDDDMCRRLTGASNEPALALLDYCEKTGRPVWIRHVAVPGYTLDAVLLTRLADYIRPYRCVERVELLPFHKMGEYKWEQLGRQYLLGGTREPTEDEMLRAREIFAARGIDVR